MSKFKKFIAGIVSAACLFSLNACGEDSAKLTPDAEDVPKQNTAQIYNDAVEKLLAAGSYTMTGSVNSSSVMGDVVTSVVTSIDCRYAKEENGSAVMLMNSEQHYDGSVFPHTTYFAEDKYYISALDSNYIVTTNDFGDYDAAMFIKKVEDTAISNYNVQSADDGTGYQVRFEIPFGIYASEALDGLIGMFADDTLLQQPVTVRALIDDAGLLTSIYVDVENSTTFDEEQIMQSITLSLQLSEYDKTTVAAPEGLVDYGSYAGSSKR